MENKAILRMKLLASFTAHALEVQRKALSGINSRSYRELLKSLNRDHERHIDELRGFIGPTGGDVFGKGTVESKVVGDAMHALDTDISERTRLVVCKKWEEHMVEGYEEAIAEKHSSDITALLEGHLADEVRHNSLLDGLLEGK